MDNYRVPPVDSLAVFHPMPQEAFKEGKALVLDIGGRHLGPDGWNLLVGWDASDVVEVHSHIIESASVVQASMEASVTSSTTSVVAVTEAPTRPE